MKKAMYVTGERTNAIDVAGDEVWVKGRTCSNFERWRWVVPRLEAVEMEVYIEPAEQYL